MTHERTAMLKAVTSSMNGGSDQRVPPGLLASKMCHIPSRQSGVLNTPASPPGRQSFRRRGEEHCASLNQAVVDVRRQVRELRRICAVADEQHVANQVADASSDSSDSQPAQPSGRFCDAVQAMCA
jgi:hypothetical protein